jgi:membrane protease YdiL (CAAX protease family)
MDSLPQIILILAPVLLLLTTYFAFRQLVSRFGPRRGYLAGFLFYWIAWGFLLPLWLLGPQGVARLYRLGFPILGNPAWLGALLLIFPLLLGYGYAFPRAIRQATLQILLLSMAIAIINGALEELLWRGAYIAAFPGQWFLGMIYPAIGFAIWHFAPQSVFPNKAPGGNLSLVVVAGIVGLMWGWVAMQIGSLLLVTLSHILFDFSGLGGRIYLSPSKD